MDRVKLQETIRAVAVQREAQARRVSDAEASVDSAMEELEAHLGSYNSTADHLQLIPASAKRAEGVLYEARLDRSAAAAADIVTIDFKVWQQMTCNCMQRLCGCWWPVSRAK